ncbi:MAG TPA: FHA domain-containing protein [Fimbriimonadaceae bacterium]|nr:FHA domain-containing protein [Fimbriimonadaceae bacterium]
MDPNKTNILTADPNRTQLGAPPTLDPNKTMLGTAPTLNATVTIKPVQCPVCKTFNPAGMMFCVDCGLIFDRALPDDAFGAPAVQLPQFVEQSGREHPIRPGTNSIGREGDIMLVDGRVSRRHAQITSDQGALTIEDLGSTNGTKVNGSALAQGEKVTLQGGETISFGGLEVKLAMPGAKGGNTTQIISSNKTAAISTPPKVEVPPAKLIGEGRAIPLKKGANTFGRKADNDVQIADPYVSGKHGIIEIAADGLFITDIGSTNGTMLNDAKLSPNMRTAITTEDVIRLGSMEFRIEVDPAMVG